MAGREPHRSATEDAPISEVSEPWDSLDMLECTEHEPDFDNRWRGFLRDCTALLLAGLPPEAARWAAVADEFEAGRLTAEELTAARILAWQFHDARRDVCTPTELSGLRAVMCRLWPSNDGRWREGAWHFLHMLSDAGLPEDRWWPLLRTRFVSVIGRISEAV